MPPRDLRMYLSDMLESAERIEQLTLGKSLQDYAADENLRLIVERSFEIIGEALRQALAMEPSLEKSVTHARRIIDFRNFLIHAYHLVDHSIVWDVIETYLPILKNEVERLLREGGETSP